MLNENAKKWVAALRSGKYTQARSYLTTASGDCCLGVACKLFMAEHPDELWPVLSGGGIIQYAYANEDEDYRWTVSLPPMVQIWLGLRTENGNYGPMRVEALATDNDDGFTFEEIADIIEAEPEQLFVENTVR